MKKQNEISHHFLQGSDLKQREQEILKDASSKLNFLPTELIDRSAWWGSSEIGAFHYAGIYQNKKAVLKIQGIKPNTSEIYMIKSFKERNSKLITPPYLYNFLPWDSSKRYEALVLEFIEGEKIIQIPTNEDQVEEFFKIYKDYRTNSRHSPWIPKPSDSLSSRIADNFTKWKEISAKIYPHHPLRKDSDMQLIDKATNLLVERYKGVAPEFQHGHLSEGDLYKVGSQVVILSNLYWSWRQPFYDAIFCYHWFIYHLNTVDGIIPVEVEKQRKIWLDNIYKLVGSKEEGGNLLKLALLERAAAGLNLDVLSADPNKPITKYLIKSTREIIENLLSELS